MANVTVLDVVQRLLSDMDSDTVNSLSETIEATQVANVVRDCYESIADEHRMYGQHRAFQLESLSDLDHPNYLKVPEGYFNIQWINYDGRLATTDAPKYGRVLLVEPAEFVMRVNMRSSDDASVTQIEDFNGVKLNIVTDKTPNYYTTFDNVHLIFDSYNIAVEDTLMESKSQAYGQFRPHLVLSDDTVIDLPHHLMSLLMSEARETCFEYFKDGAPQKITRTALRQRVRAQRTDNNLGRMTTPTLPDYGRRPRR